MVNWKEKPVISLMMPTALTAFALILSYEFPNKVS